MGQALDRITDELRAFIEAQHVFFVATAPLAGDGHINLSPKGMNTFRVLSPTRIAYLDLTGSGNETAAHVAQNGRITFMFCAFEGKPLILRIYGAATTVTTASAQWKELAAQFPAVPGIRQIIAADVRRVQTSCGFGVPLMSFTADRDALARWAQGKGEDGLADYRQRHNRASVDGLIAPPFNP
jgi:hypothetical protein